MKPVPFSNAYPDLANLTPFKSEQHDGFIFAYFNDIKPLGARNGGHSIIFYRYVLSVSQEQIVNAIYFVTAEIGMMFGTSKICAFDSDGVHHNLGDWPKEAGAQHFVDMSQRIAADFVKKREDLDSEGMQK
jgi:hypothetical protein